MTQLDTHSGHSTGSEQEMQHKLNWEQCQCDWRHIVGCTDEGWYRWKFVVCRVGDDLKWCVGGTLVKWTNQTLQASLFEYVCSQLGATMSGLRSDTSGYAWEITTTEMTPSPFLGSVLLWERNCGGDLTNPPVISVCIFLQQYKCTKVEQASTCN